MLCDMVDDFRNKLGQAYSFVVSQRNCDGYVTASLGRVVGAVADLSTLVDELRKNLGTLCARFSTGGASAGQTLDAIREFTRTVVAARDRELTAARAPPPPATLQPPVAQDGGTTRPRRLDLGAPGSPAPAYTTSPMPEVDEMDATLESMLGTDDSIFTSPRGGHGGRASSVRGRRGGRIGSRKVRLNQQRKA